MAKEMDREKDNNNNNNHNSKKMFVGVVWNCAAELKLLLTALLFLCSLATVFQFLPAEFSFSVSDLRHCISTTTAVVENVSVADAVSISVPPPPSMEREQITDDGVTKRVFNPYGNAAYNFVLMSAYRGGLNTFAVLGLSSKPLHVFGKPTYECEWVPNPTDGDNHSSITVTGQKILPDWGYGRVYTVVVVNCTFPVPVGGGSGGKLLVHASTSEAFDRNFNLTDTIEALIEKPNSLNPSQFTSPPKYDYFYCGSSLFGNLSPQRVREWLAYHIKLFGEKSHFVLHDAGGVHSDVMEVLRPWMEKGYVTLHNIREEERFDGYYHNQFLIVNDCLHRYKFMAKWMFFFDVDEFIFVPKKSTIKTVMDSFSDFTQFTIEQMPMSNKLCLAEDAGKSYRKWGFEKLVYKDSKTGIRRDRKYVIQPRNVFATGVHMSENTVGNTTHKTEGRIMYYHFHGTISERREPCQKMINTPEVNIDGLHYVVDSTMRDAAGAVKRFELKMIGSRLQRTRQ